MRPLTAKVGKKIMSFATMMSMATSSLLLGVHLHDRDGLWEIACAPHSWLSESAQQQGLRPRRINLEAGYDLYHPETWIRLRSLRDQHRPRRLWFSLPCTKWCPLTSVNYNTPELREKLERYRRRERKLMRLSCDFIKERRPCGRLRKRRSTGNMLDGSKFPWCGWLRGWNKQTKHGLIAESMVVFTACVTTMVPSSGSNG